MFELNSAKATYAETVKLTEKCIKRAKYIQVFGDRWYTFWYFSFVVRFIYSCCNLTVYIIYQFKALQRDSLFPYAIYLLTFILSSNVSPFLRFVAYFCHLSPPIAQHQTSKSNSNKNVTDWFNNWKQINNLVITFSTAIYCFNVRFIGFPERFIASRYYLF